MRSRNSWLVTGSGDASMQSSESKSRIDSDSKSLVKNIFILNNFAYCVVRANAGTIVIDPVKYMHGYF